MDLKGVGREWPQARAEATAQAVPLREARQLLLPHLRFFLLDVQAGEQCDLFHGSLLIPPLSSQESAAQEIPETPPPRTPASRSHRRRYHHRTRKQPPLPTTTSTTSPPLDTRPVVKLERRERIDAADLAVNASSSSTTVRTASRPHLPPKPKVKALPKHPPTDVATMPDQMAAPVPAAPPPPRRIQGSIGRQHAQRARTLALRSAVKSKARPLQRIIQATPPLLGRRFPHAA